MPVSRASRTNITTPRPVSRAKLGQQVYGVGPPEFGISAELPALSVCRLEAREELLRKLRRHVDDPALADFTCPICWEPFWQPVRTVCGHAFCEGCLLKSVLAQLGHDQPDVSCPMCRHPLHVDDVTADQALLTRIRLVLTERTREEQPAKTSGNGRICRGLVRGSTPVPGASSSSSAAGYGGSGHFATSPPPGGGMCSRPGTSHGEADLRSLALGSPFSGVTGRPCTPQAQVGGMDSEGMSFRSHGKHLEEDRVWWVGKAYDPATQVPMRDANISDEVAQVYWSICS
ncbi:unnamed protein product [Polarella glacialis]|uniref:RING-type domain-containing protein n=1 Tax=Polarella glacialis TaxID=89957 RepID=A0A813HTU8_POLGL|nr:unnamed protein product [Polarella glacialis]